jgi:hypothetical protein
MLGGVASSASMELRHLELESLHRHAIFEVLGGVCRPALFGRKSGRGWRNRESIVDTCSTGTRVPSEGVETKVREREKEKRHTRKSDWMMMLIDANIMPSLTSREEA